MIYLVYVIHLLVCFFLILVVLLQQGKGADLSVFGGGSTQTAFGAVGATSLLHRLTVGSFVLFIFTTMTIAILQGHQDRGVMGDFAEEQVESPGTADDAPASAMPVTAEPTPPVGDVEGTDGATALPEAPEPTSEAGDSASEPAPAP